MAHRSMTVRVRRVSQIGTTRVTVNTVFNLTTRVCHSCDRKPGLRRERTRTGFRYRTATGTLIRDPDTLARLKAIAIPPAWEDVWICPNAKGHLQATGRDARGRKQYRYHPAFRYSKENEKFGHLAAFGLALVKIRKRVEADLALPGLPKEKVLAAVVRLLDKTHLRVGNVEYMKDNHSFGLSTLLDKHVSFAGGTLRLHFRGKSGIWHEREVSDKTLVKVVRTCHHLPGHELFKYRGEDGKLNRIGSTEVNAYIRLAAGGSFTAKDYRTWAGTVAALSSLSRVPVPTSKTRLVRTVNEMIKEVAAELGNTPAVCRKSYIHPRVIEAFTDGTIPDYRKRPGLSLAESGVLQLLSAERQI